MATTTRAAKFGVTLSLLSLPLVSVPSYAEQTKDWDINPTLALGLNYTNNLELSSSDEIESVITRVSPGIDISRQGRYLSSGVAYQLQLVEYSGSDRSNDYHHSLNAFANAELVEDHLFIDTRATASQKLIDNRNAGSGVSMLDPDNFTNTLTFVLSPRWQQRVGDYTNLGLSTTYDAVLYKTGAENNEGLSYNFSLDTRDNPNKIYWTLDTRQSGAKSRHGASLTKEDAVEAQLGYRFSRQLDLRLGGGYIDNHLDNPTDDDVSAGSFWSSGLTWSPNPRATVEIYYSDQLQATNSRGLTFNLRRKRSSIMLSYQQRLSSVRQELLIPGLAFLVCPGGNASSPECRSVAINSAEQINPSEVVDLGIGLFPSLNVGRFINDSFNADYRYSYSKSSLSLSLFGNQRKFQDLTNRVEKDWGVNFGGGLRLSGRTSININYTWSALEPDSNAALSERDYRQGVNLSMSRNLSPDATVDLTLRFNQLSSDDSSREYDEYGAGVRFNQSF